MSCEHANIVVYEERMYTGTLKGGKVIMSTEADHVEAVEVRCLDCDETFDLEVEDEE